LGVDRLDGFIGTFSGLRFWPLDPNPAKILIDDIAHALAHRCRFGGHSSKFYSVAEHCVHVSQLCLPEHALWGLLHDASEAYLVDLPRPLKLLPEFAVYREAERRLQRAVAVRFGLAPEQPASVTEADDTMLWIEAHSLLGAAHSYPLNSATEPHFGQCQICSGLQDSCSLNSASVSLDGPHLWQRRRYPL
jgi:hypothetical protein